jgi:hypothetical protein
MTQRGLLLPPLLWPRRKLSREKPLSKLRPLRRAIVVVAVFELPPPQAPPPPPKPPERLEFQHPQVVAIEPESITGE